MRLPIILPRRRYVLATQDGSPYTDQSEGFGMLPPSAMVTMAPSPDSYPLASPERTEGYGSPAMSYRQGYHEDLMDWSQSAAGGQQRSNVGSEAITRRLRSPYRASRLDHIRSLYRCVPLPDVPEDNPEIHPVLEYRSWGQEQTRETHCYHGDYICPPATKPAVRVLEIELPNKAIIRVCASPATPGAVTLGNVLAAIENALVNIDISHLSYVLQSPYASSDYYDGAACPCSRNMTFLDYLGRRFGKVGLLKRDVYSNTWVLLLG